MSELRKNFWQRNNMQRLRGMWNIHLGQIVQRKRVKQPTILGEVLSQLCC